MSTSMFNATRHPGRDDWSVGKERDEGEDAHKCTLSTLCISNKTTTGNHTQYINRCIAHVHDVRRNPLAYSIINGDYLCKNVHIVLSHAKLAILPTSLSIARHVDPTQK